MSFVARVLLCSSMLGCATQALAGYTYTRSFTGVPGFRNFYYTSFPGSIGLEDVANSGVTWSDKCNITGVGGDGILNSDDAICTYWGDSSTPRVRLGSFSIATVELAQGQLLVRKAEVVGPIGTVFVGIPFAIDPSVGYLIIASPPRGATQQVTNVGVLTGPCLPPVPPQPLQPNGILKQFIAVPDDTTLVKAAEVLCGKEGVDWVDLVRNLDGFPPGDGMPDTCPNGAYDPVRGRRVAVTTFDNEPGNNEFPNTDNLNITLSTVFVAGRFSIHGSNFTLRPGQGLTLNTLVGFTPHDWNPPVDPTECNNQ